MLDVTRQMIRAALGADGSVSEEERTAIGRVLAGDFGTGETNEEVLTLEGAAARLNVSRTTLWRMRKGKSVGPVRISGRHITMYVNGGDASVLGGPPRAWKCRQARKAKK